MSVLDLPELIQQNDGCVINGKTNIDSLIIRNLYKITSSGNWTEYIANGDTNIKSIYLPSLVYMTNNVGVDTFGGSKIIASGCTSIEEIILPNLIEFSSNPNGAGGVYYGSSTTLRKVVLGPLEIVNPVYLFDNWSPGVLSNIMHFEVGVDTKANFSIIHIVPVDPIDNTKTNMIEDTFCLNNLEQFLYNFRTYVIDRLYNYTGGTKHYIYVSSVVKNTLFGETDDEYAKSYNMPDESVDYVTSIYTKLGEINWGIG